jgi:class 3 adenylate cyclase
VKTIGDAVMAVFRQPVIAFRAIEKANAAITKLEGLPNLSIKVGIHTGTCIAVTLNERLDYFGSTVNISARLPGLANGGEIVFSNESFNDPEVQEWLKDKKASAEMFRSGVKGFDEAFDLWRMKL